MPHSWFQPISGAFGCRVIELPTKRTRNPFPSPIKNTPFLPFNWLSPGTVFFSEEERNTFEKSFDFLYQYFAITVIQIAPTSIFYDEYSLEDYHAIKTGLYEIIKDIFSRDYQCYILPSDNDILTIVYCIWKQKIENRSWIPFKRSINACMQTGNMWIYPSEWVKFIPTCTDCKRHIKKHRQAFISITKKHRCWHIPPMTTLSSHKRMSTVWSDPCPPTKKRGAFLPGWNQGKESTAVSSGSEVLI